MARINEIGDTEKGQYALGRLRARKFKKDGFKKGNEVGKYAEKARDKSSLYTKTVDGCNDTFYSPSKYKNLTDSHANGWHDEMHKNESKNMKKGMKLTESELKMVIEGAVRNILKEYGDKEATRAKMALAAKKSLNKGDASTYNNAINSLAKRGSSKKEMSDFQDKFEKTDFNEQPTNNMVGENQVKMTEAELYSVLKESINKVLTEAFKSPKLDAMARQHGGIRKGGYGFYGGNEFPISDLTDDMVGDEASRMDDVTGIADNAVNFKDGTSVPITNKEKAMGMQKDFNNREEKRGRWSTPGDYYTRHNVAPTEDQRHLQALRKDLKTSSRLRRSDNDLGQSTYKSHWKNWENPTRQQINQAYGQNRGQRNIGNIGN